jgi:hypothetical protein
MNLYISKDNQQLGPYTLDQARQLVANGTFQATDWAWHEGSADWVPLQQVPGFAIAAPAPYVPIGAAPAASAVDRPRRPVLVWIICLFYFIFGPLGLIAIAATPFLLSFADKAEEHAQTVIQHQLDRTTDPALRDRLTTAEQQISDARARVAHSNQRGPVYYAVAIVSCIVGIVAAIYLFMLRRLALYLFLAAFGIGLLQSIYLYTMGGVFQGLAPGALAITIGATAFAWVIVIGIIFYVWLLFKRGVLR